MGLNEVLALLIAVCVHELGHLLAIYMLGLRVTGLHLELSGLRIDYAGISSTAKNVLTAFAGPMAGILYFMTGLFVAEKTGNFVLMFSAKLSIVYSCFNLLPMLPLDGGRILTAIAESLLGGDEAGKLSSVVSTIFGLAFLILGLFCMLQGEGSGMFAAGLWLLLLQN